MMLFFGVPAENFEKAKEVLAEYKDLIAEVRASRGSAVNVYENITEEIPARFFHVLLKKEADAEDVAKKLSEDLTRKKIFYPNEPCWKILIFNRDTF